MLRRMPVILVVTGALPEGSGISPVLRRTPIILVVTGARPSWTVLTGTKPPAAWLLQQPWREAGTHSPAALQDTKLLLPGPILLLLLTGSFPGRKETTLVSNH